MLQERCLQNFSLIDIFQSLLYDEQNLYLNGLLHCRKTVKTSGHPRRDASGKKIGRPQNANLVSVG